MKLWATIKKDLRILSRDKVGLALLFGMPIVLVLIVTSIQNNAFQPFSKNGTVVLIENKDTGRYSRQLIQAIDKMGLFRLEYSGTAEKKGSLMTIIIPHNYSAQVAAAAKEKSDKALRSFGLDSNKNASSGSPADGDSLVLLYDPKITPAIRAAAGNAINAAAQLIESKEVIGSLYYSINERPLPDSLAAEMLGGRTRLREQPLMADGASLTTRDATLNATQHNVPAWTIFAMFFVVMSLGGSIVREKQNGSFIRLKTLPTNYMIALLSKQIAYVAVTFLQATVLFAMGLWLFPHIGLPALRLPGDIAALILVTLLCGWCAVSYAIAIGVFARTAEQANGFGAVSVVILAIIGGLMVPSFIMPEGFRTAMQFSPLHWALQSYYGLFLEGGKLKDILINVLPLFVITLLIQVAIMAGLRTKRLI